MPTVKNIAGPYRFFFYSFDCNEPKHVHAQRETAVCKYWLEPVSLASNHRYAASELNAIRNVIMDNKTKIMEAWDEHCGHTSGS